MHLEPKSDKKLYAKRNYRMNKNLTHKYACLQSATESMRVLYIKGEKNKVSILASGLDIPAYKENSMDFQFSCLAFSSLSGITVKVLTS